MGVLYMSVNLNAFLKITILSMLIFCSSNSIAVSITEGVNAVNDNDNTEAVKIWIQLAEQGNTVAKYNLASHYSTGSGVEQDEQTANEWFKEAARTGLVGAYLNLNNQAIEPANGKTISFLVAPELWLSKQEPKKYTIQLSSSRYEKSIKKLYETHNIKSKGGYYHYVRQGTDRYALVYGTYDTVASANNAIKELPSNMRKTTPWVRKIQTLQKISK